MTPIEILYQAAKGKKVISASYVIEMLEKNESEAPISLLRTKETKYRDLV